MNMSSEPQSLKQNQITNPHGPSGDITRLTDRQLTWPHWVYQWICLKLLKFYIICRFKLHVTGRENIPSDWLPCVVVSNHTSAMDPPLVSIGLDYRPIAYMAKKELFVHPLMRTYMHAMSSFAVNREKLDVSTAKTAMKVLKHGKWALAIFPEGTRQRDGALGDAKKGAAYFAKMGKVPILPMAIVHSVEKNGRKRIDLRIGPLMPYEKDIDALADRIQETIAALIAEVRKERSVSP